MAHVHWVRPVAICAKALVCEESEWRGVAMRRLSLFFLWPPHISNVVVTMFINFPALRNHNYSFEAKSIPTMAFIAFYASMYISFVIDIVLIINHGNIGTFLFGVFKCFFK